MPAQEIDADASACAWPHRDGEVHQDTTGTD